MARRQRRHARARIDQREHVLRFDPPRLAWLKPLQLDAPLGERHPRVDIGGVVIAVHDEVVARSPVDTVRNEAQAKRGRTDKRDLAQFGAE